MAYTVFFKEQNQIFNAQAFINEQPVQHRHLLSTIAEELSTKGSTSNSLVSKNSNGEWTIVVNDNGDVYVYTLYVSKLELSGTQSEQRVNSEKTTTLVIIDPTGPRDSVGGYHPGYWPEDEYAKALEENVRPLFKDAISQIKQRTPSPAYTIEDDGTISMHINGKEKSAIISLNCRAKWI